MLSHHLISVKSALDCWLNSYLVCEKKRIPVPLPMVLATRLRHDGRRLVLKNLLGCAPEAQEILDGIKKRYFMAVWVGCDADNDELMKLH